MKKILALTFLQTLALGQIAHGEEKSPMEKIGEKIGETLEEVTPAEEKTEVEKIEGVAGPSNLKVETLTFPAGATQLSVDDKAKLKAFIESAVATGTIKEIKVASWSDRDVPTDPTKSLSKDDRRMAEERANAVRKYLRDQLKMKKVETYNMAHGAGRIAKAFRTEEAELRAAFASKDAAPGKLRPEVIAIRDHGKASTVVLVVEFKELKTK